MDNMRKYSVAKGCTRELKGAWALIGRGAAVELTPKRLARPQVAVVMAFLYFKMQSVVRCSPFRLLEMRAVRLGGLDSNTKSFIGAAGVIGALVALLISTQATVTVNDAIPANLKWGLLTAMAGLLVMASLPKLGQKATTAAPTKEVPADAPSPFATLKPQLTLARMAMMHNKAAMQASGPLDNLLPADSHTSDDSSAPTTPLASQSSGMDFFHIRAYWGSETLSRSVSRSESGNNDLDDPLASVPSRDRSFFSHSGAVSRLNSITRTFSESGAWRSFSQSGSLSRPFSLTGVPSEGAWGAVEWLLSGVTTQMVVGTMLILGSLPALMSVSPWLILCYPVVGGWPFAMNAFLHSIKTGWIVPTETRRKHNSRFIYNVALLSFFNIALTASQGMLFIWFGIYIGQIEMNIIPKDPFSLATLFRVLWQTFFQLLAADVLNYVFHRAAHENKWLYRHLHYLHHEHNHVEHALYSLFYVHPIEMFLSNVCFFNGIFWFKTDLFVIMLCFATISSVTVCAGHSGLKLPRWAEILLDPAFHHLHHSRYKCNYSEHFTITDKLFGTYVSEETLAAAAAKKQQAKAQ